MGFWRRVLVYLSLVDEEDYEEADDVGYAEPPQDAPVGIRKLSREELSTVHPLPSARPLGQVHIVEPRIYDDAKEIGDKLRDLVPVIMNLQGVEEDLSKRLIAFASGLAYGLGGGVQRLAPRVYLITPQNVQVSAEDRRRLAERGLFSEF